MVRRHIIVNQGDDLWFLDEHLLLYVQGLGNKTKKEWIKELSINHKLNFIAIQETKMDKISHMDVKLMWGNSNYDFVCSDDWENYRYDGFDELVEQTWRSFLHSDRNGMIRFRKKLQDLKITIRQWIKDKRMHLSSSKKAIHDELTAIYKELDCGMATDTSLARRQHSPSGHKINYLFPKRLAQDQANDLERSISRDEIRVVVWNYGDNKSPGPDGYTFEFFKKSSPSWGSGPVIFARYIYVLKCIYLELSLQSKIHKSQLLGVGVPKSEVESAASSIGCSIMNNQFRYLGVMVGENMARHKAWVDVVLKLKFRLSKWKAKTLSFGRKGATQPSVSTFPRRLTCFELDKNIFVADKMAEKGSLSSSDRIGWNVMLLADGTLESKY
ncbi:hypothetical protein Tco_1359652 [Tanacetum coccineum]